MKPARAGLVPAPLGRRSSDEYAPPPYTDADREALARVAHVAPERGRRAGVALPAWLAGRCGTAAALRAIDAAAGGGYYDVPEDATRDAAAAAAALGGGELVIDVQTHFVADHRVGTEGAAAVLAFLRGVAPDRFRDLGGAAGLSLAEFLRCVFVESETAVAVLTAAPGDERRNILSNDEIAGTRELVDRLAGTGRLLHHAIVHPEAPGELERLSALVGRSRPDGLKVYTLYGVDAGGRAAAGAEAAPAHAGWMLDDERTGLPFLERARSLGVRRVCAHKGLSGLAPAGSPRDVGPAAAAFPDLDLLVYHSGYEVPEGGAGEGPFREDAARAGAALRGTDRLVASLRRAGVGPGSNVYAELGSTWYILMRRPREAAHVLGKLLLAVGEDNVLWGTDSVWYGPCQPLIDAFRAFRIPEALCERHGYPPLTPARKAKILGANAARVYGVDAARARAAAADDDLAWVRAAVDEARRAGPAPDGMRR